MVQAMSKPDDIPTLLDAEEAFEAGDVETALVIAEGLLGDDETKAEPEVLHLAAECLLELQEGAEAGHLLDIAIEKIGDDPVLLHARGVAFFETGRLDESASWFRRAADGDPDLGEALFYLGILAERSGDLEEASRLFGEAVQRDPENLVEPVDWPKETIEQVFDEIVEEIPDPLGVWLAGLELVIEDLPSDEVLAVPEGTLSPLILALFAGERRTEPDGEDPDEWLQLRPKLIRVFRLNLGKSAQDEYELHRELLEAILWEVMDFLGLDESHLAMLGLPEEVDDDDLHPGAG
jgi:tetratricopeptide (TPR) repeat protein